LNQINVRELYLETGKNYNITRCEIGNYDCRQDWKSIDKGGLLDY